jgi:hypothetical protein
MVGQVLLGEAHMLRRNNPFRRLFENLIEQGEFHRCGLRTLCVVKCGTAAGRGA